MADTFAGHGVRKMQPICSRGSPVFFTASSFASRAASSIGAISGRMWSISCGKRTQISRVTAGHADEMIGRGMSLVCKKRRVASLTSSAARETSNTLSNPRRKSPASTTSGSSRLLNCAYRLGGGSAILYLYCFNTSSGSDTARLA